MNCVFSDYFVSASNEFNTFKKHIAAPYMRKSFIIKDLPHVAEITVCGLGFYKIYINGTEITKGHLAPYITASDDILFYDCYDLKEYLHSGKNVLAFILGNGMQNAIGGCVWEHDKAPWHSSPKLAFALNLDDDIITAESGVKVKNSPIYFDDLRCGEFYDARLETIGWNSVNLDDSDWADSIHTETPRGEKKLCLADPIVTTREIKPVNIKKCSIGRQPALTIRSDVFAENGSNFIPPDEDLYDGWLYDFGENTAGVCTMKINGKKGQKVILQFGEYIYDDKLDLFAMHMLTKRYNHRDIYICKGEDNETYTPSFTYHGFRYCLVMGIDDEQATNDLLTYQVQNSDLKECGNFSCSDEIANKLQEATRRSDLANFFYFLTDCPHREKNGWTGDTALSCEHILLNLQAEKSLKVWLDCVRKAQAEDGAIPSVVPTGGYGYTGLNGPAWEAALTWTVHTIWKYRGDVEVLKENAIAIFRYVNHLSLKRNSDGLINYGLGDWCDVGRHPADYKCPLEVSDTLISMDICNKAAEIFEELNMTNEKLYAESLANDLRNEFRKKLIDKSTMLVAGNCQTAQAAALYFGAFENGERPEAFKRLLELIHIKDDHIDLGIIGGRVIFHVLSDFGYADLAYKMITRTDYPSYGNWIANGATTLYEGFYPGVQNQSLNHHFWGDISNWFISVVAGLKVVNHTTVNIKPSFIKSLSNAEAYHVLPLGEVKVRWERVCDGINLSVTAPKNINGKIILPFGYVFENDLSQIKLTDGSFVYKIIAK